MNSKKIILNGSFIVFSVAFAALMMWYLPDKALDLLFVYIISVGGVSLLLRGAKVDQRKDERTIQLMSLGGRNAFIFLLLAMPALASLDIAGILILGTAIALWILWAIAIAIAWITFLYYYTR